MKIIKFTGVGLVVLSVVVVVGLGLIEYRSQGPFDAPYPNVAATDDREVIAHGEWLVHGPAACGMCHLPLEQSATLEPGATPALVGGFEFAVPGFAIVRSPNITPDDETGIGTWTDAEIARMIRYGVDRHGSGSLSMWFTSGELSDEDLTAIVSYLRTTESVRQVNGRTDRGLAYKFMLAFFFEPATLRTYPTDNPERGPNVPWGAHLAHGPAKCAACHSPVDPTTPTPNKPFGGGEIEPDYGDAAFEFRPPNLTPHPSGITGRWNEEQFVQRFRTGRIIPRSMMPWSQFTRLEDDDVRAIYRYLRTVEPVDRDTGPGYRESGWGR